MTATKLVPDKDDPRHKSFSIEIDRTKYEWSEEKIDGAQLRGLPEPPIPPERNLFLVVPGHPDRRIKDGDTVEVHDGLRFFTETKVPKSFTIRIDRADYEWLEDKISGAQLRRLPPTPIPPERDLFQVVPGQPDRKIKDDDTVEVHDGLRFFTETKVPKPFTIRIDRTEYEWSEHEISGAQLRELPSTPIPPERDIFQIVPGHPDKKIEDDDAVEVRDGLRFFTAPNTINPGTAGTYDRPAP